MGDLFQLPLPLPLSEADQLRARLLRARTRREARHAGLALIAHYEAQRARLLARWVRLDALHEAMGELLRDP